MKKLNLLSRILLTFLLAFLTIMISAGLVIYQKGSGKLSSMKKSEVHAEIHNMVNTLELLDEQRKQRLEQSIEIMDIIFDEALNHLEIDSSKSIFFKAKNQFTSEITEIEIPTVKIEGQQLQYNYDFVDKIRDITGANATIFQRFEKGYIRISTNITGGDMHRATGTYIPLSSDVSKALDAGKPYYGKAFVVNQYYQSVYRPVRIDGKPVMAIFVGNRIRDMETLLNNISNQKLLDEGDPIIISGDEYNKGKVLISKQYEGEQWKHGKQASAAFFNKLKPIEAGKYRHTTFFENGFDYYYTWYEPLQLYIGIKVPDDYLVRDLQSTLSSTLATAFGLAVILSFLIVFFGVRQYSRKLNTTISSIHTISSGKTLSVTDDTNIPELNKINEAVNRLSASLKNKTEFASEIGKGNLDVYFEPTSENDRLGSSLLEMRNNLKRLHEEQEANNWLNSSTVKVLQVLRKESDLQAAADKFLIALASILNIELGAVYLYNEKRSKLLLKGSYGFLPKPNGESDFEPGDGIIGQAAVDGQVKIYDNIDLDYVQVKFSTGKQKPRKVIAIPFLYNDEVIGVVELGTLVENVPRIRFKLINHISESVAATFYNIQNNEARQELLKRVEKQKTDLEKQALELQQNQEELKQTNEELQSQTRALEESEANLETQQEELRVTNEQLQENLKSSQEQKAEINEKNITLENIKDELQRKADELEKASRFKSEFLANMSHELRTPLNSLLILAQSMTENEDQNLTEEQIETIQIIYNSGKDLLNLINDILDLSKIEAGKMDIDFQEVDLSDTMASLRASFSSSAKQKGIEFKIKIEKGTPHSIRTDRQRMEQILRNLLSNALKFTSKGEVSVRFYKPSLHDGPKPEQLTQENVIGITVHDTGMGIPEEKKEAIFEAFQQVDGSISRRFGGTGLGLSISKELCNLLGGDITLQSVYGEGTDFTLFLPVNEKSKTSNISASKQQEGTRQTASEENKTKSENPRTAIVKEPEPVQIDDDRESIKKDDHILEIIEDDVPFVKTLMGIARKKGFKVIATTTGEDGLRLCRQYKPNAIILDIGLPGIDGYQVLEEIKNDTEIRHIPVHIASGMQEDISLYQKGALGFLKKPVEKQEFQEVLDSLQDFLKQKVKNLLIIEDEKEQRKAIRNLLNITNANITECDNGADAVKELRENSFDSVVLDLELKDTTGFELLDKLKNEDIALPPVIIYTGKDLSKEETEKLQEYAQSIIIKGARSEERLLDETSLFLHSVIKELPTTKQKVIKDLHQGSEIFKDKKVLLVDDDIRNLFVLNRILEEKGFATSKAQNGEKALEVLEKDNSFDLILMDIMMPVMDGFEATRKIKENPKTKNIPVIALTAKGMKGDREKCMQAGADDYMVKPVDIKKLLTTMKIWLQNG